MTKEESTKKVQEALANGKCLSVRFYADGSGADFHIIDPHGDHGLPCSWSIGLPIEDAMQCVCGFRFKQFK